MLSFNLISVFFGMAAVASAQYAAQIPLGLNSINGGGYLRGIGGLTGYSTAGLPYGLHSGGIVAPNYLNAGYPLGRHHPGLVGYGVAPQVGYPLHSGIQLDRGLALNGGILPYGGAIGRVAAANGLVHPNGLVAAAAPVVRKTVTTSNDVVISHGAVGQSRQWLNRFDKN